jgi:hypothetical protein
MEVLRMEETKMTTTELYHNIQDLIQIEITGIYLRWIESFRKDAKDKGEDTTSKEFRDIVSGILSMRPMGTQPITVIKCEPPQPLTKEQMRAISMMASEPTPHFHIIPNRLKLPDIQDAIANIYKEIDRLERKIDTQ